MRFLSAATAIALALASPALAQEAVFRTELKAPILFTQGSTPPLNPNDPGPGTGNPAPGPLQFDLAPNFADWATIGDGVDTGFAISGGTPPYAYAFKDGIRPNDLQILNGRLVGTFLDAGSTSFAIVASDSSTPAKTAEKNVVLDVETQPQIASHAALIQGTVGTPVTVVEQASGGKPPYVWSVTNTDGTAQIGSDGTIVVDKEIAGETGTIRAGLTDARSRAASGTEFKVNFSEPLSLSYPSSVTMRVGAALNISPSVVGGRGTKQFIKMSGDVPGGLTYSNQAGTLVGTTTSACVACSAQIEVTDADGRRAVATLNTNVVDAPTVSGLAASYAWRNNVAIAPIALSALGTQGTATWSLTAGSLPGGVSLNASTGSVSGTPNGTGSGTMTFKVADSLGDVYTQQATWAVTAPTIVLNASYPAEALAPFTLTPTVNNTVNGGAQTRTFSLVSPPSGMTINATTGKIDWTPSTAGNYSAQVHLTDTDGSTGSAILNLVVAPSTVGNGGQIVATTSLPTQPSNGRTLEYTYPQRVFITTWWVQAQFSGSGTCSVQATLYVQNETTGTWDVAGSIPNNSASCPRSVYLTGTVSGGQVIGKKFRVTMIRGSKSWDNSNMSIGTAQGMQ